MPSSVTIVRMLTRLNIGGPALHAAVLCNRLDARRYRTCLVIGRPDPSEGDLRGLIHDAAAQVVQIDSLRRDIRLWADLRSWLRLVTILQRTRPAIIHTHMAKAGTLGRLAGWWYNHWGAGRRKAHRAILIHTFHGHVLEGYFSPWKTRLFLAIERWLARRTDCLIAVSPTVKRELHALGIGSAAQWRVIPVGLALSHLAQMPLPNGAAALRFGLIGRLVPIKHPSLFLEVMERLARQPSLGQVQGLIVGDGPLRRSLEEESQRRGLAPMVRFTGWQRDLPSVYGGIEVACLTSQNEGTPVALIEAMAAGRAVVATRVGGVPDLLEEDPESDGEVAPGTCRVTPRGILVGPGDAEGFARALTMLVEDAPLRRRLGESARAYVAQRFDQDRLVRDIEALYEELLKGTRDT
ncbi:MAG: glycosyltransferase [Candidatus Omnitrophica bacterium]|nr:glycosyltransferase [Candidatus Omnitrophota bacterium]